jgi:hypothetical protein
MPLSGRSIRASARTSGKVGARLSLIERRVETVKSLVQIRSPRPFFFFITILTKRRAPESVNSFLRLTRKKFGEHKIISVATLKNTLDLHERMQADLKL